VPPLSFFIAIKNAREERGWELLFRSDALMAYRAVILKAGQCKVLAEWDRAQCYELLHAAADITEAETAQARADRTEHVRIASPT
jgi:hypothetical protein